MGFGRNTEKACLCGNLQFWGLSRMAWLFPIITLLWEIHKVGVPLLVVNVHP